MPADHVRGRVIPHFPHRAWSLSSYSGFTPFFDVIVQMAITPIRSTEEKALAIMRELDAEFDTRYPGARDTALPRLNLKTPEAILWP